MSIQVLKGGSTPDRDGIDNPWKPLDDFEAPYREPKLPPPGILKFLKSFTGGSCFPRSFYLQIRLFTLKIMVQKDKFLVKMCLFI